jgi:hypothetical protein
VRKLNSDPEYQKERQRQIDESNWLFSEERQKMLEEQRKIEEEERMEESQRALIEKYERGQADLRWWKEFKPRTQDYLENPRFEEMKRAEKEYFDTIRMLEPHKEDPQVLEQANQACEKFKKELLNYYGLDYPQDDEVLNWRWYWWEREKRDDLDHRERVRQAQEYYDQERERERQEERERERREIEERGERVENERRVREREKREKEEQEERWNEWFSSEERKKLLEGIDPQDYSIMGVRNYSEIMEEGEKMKEEMRRRIEREHERAIEEELYKNRQTPESMKEQEKMKN